MPGATWLDPEIGELLKGVSQCGNRVRQLLAADPQQELMAVLDVLEPVGSTSVDRP